MVEPLTIMETGVMRCESTAFKNDSLSKVWHEVAIYRYSTDKNTMIKVWAKLEWHHEQKNCKKNEEGTC